MGNRGGLTVRAADRVILVWADAAAGPYASVEAALVRHELFAGVVLHDGGSGAAGLTGVAERGKRAVVASGADWILV